eukprot:m.470173 g.470173  ORF g.470173 m.470173 type:complete len:1092 (-) comp20368_c0_seq4:54-3329(-)
MAGRSKPPADAKEVVERLEGLLRGNASELPPPDCVWHALRWPTGNEGKKALRAVRTATFSPAADDDVQRGSLTLAASQGKLVVVQWLVQHGGADVMEADGDGLTALHCASQQGRIRVVAWLLQSGGADVETRTDFGDQTALMLAAFRGHRQVVEWLVTRGAADVREKDFCGNSAVFHAIEGQHLHIVQWLLQCSTAGIKDRNDAGSTPLLAAAEHGCLAMLQWLLHCAGADIKEADQNGDTALLLAARNGHQQIAQWLLKHGGVNIKEKDVRGDTALLRAAHNGKLEAVQWLLKHGGAHVAEVNNDGNSALLLAADNGHLDVLQFLLAKDKAGVGTRNNNEHTALLLAAANGHLNVVQWLLRHTSTSVGEADADGYTALLLASEEGHLNVVQWLLEQGGASILDTTASSSTALLRAAVRGHLGVVQWLLLSDHGSTVHEQNKDGNTALVFASSYGRLEVVQWLVQKGGSHINEANRNGITALLAASGNGHLNVVRWLLSVDGVNVRARGRVGDSALLRASNRGHLSVVCLLFEQGVADIDDQDAGGRTALHWAAKYGDADLAEFLLRQGANPNATTTDGESVMDCAYNRRVCSLVAAAQLRELGMEVLTQPNMVVCGPIAAGKTSLCKALSGNASDTDIPSPVDPTPSTSPTSPAGVVRLCERTAGIAMHSITINADGEKLTVYDFAGHPEYFITHEMVVLKHKGVFVVVVSLAEDKNSRARQLEFWPCFLAACFAPPSDDRPAVNPGGVIPRIALVLTHRDCPVHGEADVIQNVDGTWRSPWGENALRNLRARFSPRLDIYEKPFVLDCTKPGCITFDAFRVFLSNERRAIIARSAPVPSVTKRLIDALPALRAKHATWPVMSTAKFNNWILETAPLLKHHRHLVPTVVSLLNANAEIVALTKARNIFISPQFLYGDIVGKVLAPHEFPEAVFGWSPSHHDDGKVSVDNLSPAFGNQAPLVLEVLQDLGLGFSVDDTTVLVPCLLENKRPPGVWANIGATVIGRRWVCKNKNDAFGTGIFPRLQVAFHERAKYKVCLWNGGLAFVTNSEVFVLCFIDRMRSVVDLWLHGTNPDGRCCRRDQTKSGETCSK